MARKLIFHINSFIRTRVGLFLLGTGMAITFGILMSVRNELASLWTRAAIAGFVMSPLGLFISFASSIGKTNNGA